MEIGLIYSGKDPRQTQARNFVRQFIRERGLTARLTESEQPVQSPVLIVDGQSFKDQRRTKRDPKAPMFPGIADITKILERHIWSL